MKIYLNIIVCFLVIFLTGCSAQLSDAVNEKTGQVTTENKISASDIKTSKKVDLTKYNLVIATGQANNAYFVESLRKMKIFNEVETPESWLSSQSSTLQQPEVFAQQLETQNGMEKFSQLYGNTLFLNIDAIEMPFGKMEFTLTIKDMRTKTTLLETKAVPFIFTSHMYLSFLDTIYGWAKKSA